MLRTLLLIVSVAAFAVGLGVWWLGHRDALPVALWSGGLALAVAVERWRYRARTVAGEGWEPTEERFIDPESGQPMRVLFNPRTGERRYEAMAGHD
ncbi:hypothetical protein [Pelomonas cellulosilytica]|uniref:Uncharacterized protein n=1 Tax=Pelomonas cellulosilytica TaxID=2906762 RepID=A0ABS8XR67_9BURK|nr:hypothetical protein [Pelomonas sp. P8]MCE4553653.1 hypothetical protein [Pelomonas sp. P8]